MNDTEPQTAGGKVLWHFTMSLDGFVAGPNHNMDWMTGSSNRPGLLQEYVETTGAVLGGRDGWDAAGDSRPYGSAWDGPIFVLAHHPEDATPADGVTFRTATRPRRCGSGWKRPAARTSKCSRPRSAVSFLNWQGRPPGQATGRAGP